MPSYAAIAPIAQHRGREPQLACDLDQRPTAARQQGDRLRLELIRKMTPFLAHSTPSRSRRSLAKVSTNSGEAQLPVAGARRAGAAVGCPAARLDPAGDPQRAYGIMRDHGRAEHGAPVSGWPQPDAQKKTLHAAEQDRPDVAQARRVFI